MWPLIRGPPTAEPPIDNLDNVGINCEESVTIVAPFIDDAKSFILYADAIFEAMPVAGIVG